VDGYLTLSCLLPAELEDELPVILGRFPVLGCHLEGQGPDRVLTRVYFGAGSQASVEQLADLLAGLGAEELSSGTVAHTDWLAAYRAAVRPLPVGRRWWLDPHPGTPSPAPEGHLRLAIEPRMAFGSGSHESTQLVLLELEELSVAGKRVLDIGTGSGILALAADRLGSGWVVGLDLDPEAVWVARNTARQQDWPARPVFLVGPVHCLAGSHFDVILCNMLSEHFLPLVNHIRHVLAPGAQAVFSGILVGQRAAVIDELEAAGLHVTGGRTLGEWAGLRVARV
jgi:ribosomal protein L11 methyltransferase